jgi:hypothetical protein
VSMNYPLRDEARNFVLIKADDNREAGVST